MDSTIRLRLPDDLKALLKAQAETQGKTLACYMAEILAEKAAKVKARQAFVAAADASLEELERTGIAYSMEDVHEYITALAAGRKATRPKPIKVPRK